MLRCWASAPTAGAHPLRKVVTNRGESVNTGAMTGCSLRRLQEPAEQPHENSGRPCSALQRGRRRSRNLRTAHQSAIQHRRYDGLFAPTTEELAVQRQEQRTAMQSAATQATKESESAKRLSECYST